MAPSRKAAGTDEPVDPFFPGRNQPISDVQKLCLSCEVRRDCKAYGRRTGAEYGVWAGELKRRKRSDVKQVEEEDDE